MEYRQEEGDPAGIIIRTAAEGHCDLIVMGTHGRGGIGRVLLGGVTERVFRRACCPVLIARSPLPSPSTAPAMEGETGGVTPAASGPGPRHDVSRKRGRRRRLKVVDLVARPDHVLGHQNSPFWAKSILILGPASHSGQVNLWCRAWTRISSTDAPGMGSGKGEWSLGAGPRGPGQAAQEDAPEDEVLDQVLAA